MTTKEVERGKVSFLRFEVLSRLLVLPLWRSYY